MENLAREDWFCPVEQPDEAERRIVEELQERHAMKIITRQELADAIYDRVPSILPKGNSYADWGMRMKADRYHRRLQALKNGMPISPRVVRAYFGAGAVLDPHEPVVGVTPTQQK